MISTYTFYTATFLGSLLKEKEWPEYEQRAEDFIETATRGRLTEDTLPSDEKDLIRAKKAVCAAAEAFKRLDDRRKDIENGAIKSMSSGGESISYELTKKDKVIAGGPEAEQAYIFGHIKHYLTGVEDGSGIYYLYWGLR